MQLHILSLFPELFENFLQTGLLGRAIQSGTISVSCEQLRTFAVNTHGQVDDTPYGGGSGMVLRADTAIPALEAAKAKHPGARTICFSPRGKPFTQTDAHRLAAEKELILLCNRYEGVDERVLEHCVDEEISIGDFITQGGEVPAMAFIEAISRLRPDVLGNPESLQKESFEQGLLEYPQYTKPQCFREWEVPEVLRSGNHAAIAEWQKQQAILTTAKRRPDLITPQMASSLSLALVHHPVLNKEGRVITSSITNLDVHDIARSSRTYGCDSFYIAHPTKALRRLAEKICEHWNTGYGSTYNPNRKDALSVIRIKADFGDVTLDLEERFQKRPLIVTTSAKSAPNTFSYQDFRAELAVVDRPVLLVFGTGWGLADEIMELADYRLAPIYGPTDYNHLSVRAAVAIILDRIFGL